VDSDPLAHDFELDARDAPWGKLERETDWSFRAFCTYRDLGPRRTIAKAADVFYLAEHARTDIAATAGELRTFSEWSRLNDWVARAGQWDQAIERATRLEQVEQIREMGRRHAESAVTAIAKATEAIANVPPGELKPADAARLLDIGVKVERLARGEATEIQQVQGPHGGPVQTHELDDDEHMLGVIASLEQAGELPAGTAAAFGRLGSAQPEPPPKP
jgi:hypothetical protein